MTKLYFGITSNEKLLVFDAYKFNLNDARKLNSITQRKCGIKILL